MIIDGHAHLWEPARGFDIKPVKDEPLLARDFLPAELAAWCARLGIGRAVITQSAPQVEESERLLDLCRDEPLIAGVTGWVDLAAPDVGEVLRRLGEGSKLVGIRAQLRRVADPDFILREDVRRGLRAVAKHGLALVLLAEMRHHENCIRLLREEPDLRVILNHGGMPPIATGDLRSWRQAVLSYARDTSAVSQLSGFISLAGAGWAAGSIRPVVAHLLETFGPERLMFASDWPMTDVHADYGRWWALLQEFLEGVSLSPTERDAIFRDTATTAYRLDFAGPT